MRILIGVLTLVLLATLLTPLVVFGSSHRDYAHSRDSGVSDVTGLRATIETADPFVADEGGFSLGTMWIIGPDDSSGNRQWVEVGWEKDEDGPMRFFSYCAPASQCGGYDYHGNVGAGSSHYYKLEHDTGDDWKFYIDDVEERSETAGFDSGDIVDIGGEVTDPDSDIGVSGLLDVGYETDDDGDWTSFDGTETANDGFWIIEIWGTQDNMQMGTCWHEPGHC